MPAPRPRGRPRGPVATSVRVLPATKQLLDISLASSEVRTFDDLILEMVRERRAKEERARQRRAGLRRQ
jgi:hypothetical protein